MKVNSIILNEFLAWKFIGTLIKTNKEDARCLRKASRCKHMKFTIHRDNSFTNIEIVNLNVIRIGYFFSVRYN